MATKTAKPATIDEYLAAVPEEARAELERLRETIRTAAPEATETISYGMPAFKHHGSLVGFAAFKDHLSFFPMNSTLIDAHREELSGYRTSKGTIQFNVDKPLPAALVKRLVKERVAENEAGRKR